MATRSGTPYHPQDPSSAPMDQNFESLMKTLNDQMTRLNHDLGDKLAKTTQDMTHQFTQINGRLDRIETNTLARTPEAPFEPEPELELDTPLNLRRASRQDFFPDLHPRRFSPDPPPAPNPRRPQAEPNPRRFSPDPFVDLNPRRPNQNPVLDPNPRRLHHNPAYDPNPRRPNQDHLDQDDRIFKSIRLEAPTFDGDLDPKLYIDWEREMDQFFEWYDLTEERKFRFAKTKLIRQARLY